MASDDSASVCSVTITPTENETKCFSKESIADQQNVNINQNAGKMLPPNALLGVKQGAPSLLTPNTPKMASLAAPVPMQSSVYTANQPKNSLTAASASLSVASATGNPRNKVALRKGRGLMDWVRLGHTTPDLAGTGGRLLRVTPKQLAKHNTKTDAWMALRGKVYNVTPYMEYHPGGEDELSRGIGRDATELFNEVHKWVNFESMLCKCLVGHLVEQSPISCSHVLRKPQKAFLPLLNSFAKLLKSEGGSNKSKKDGITKLPPIPSPSAAACTPEVQLPSYDWYQSSTAVTLTVYSRWPRLTHRHCTVHLHHNVRVGCLCTGLL
ncbi:Cytochrome b5-like heme/steroid binding domain [Trinorchestia longiramus]|nr:Cytochrome b5-like heme/steroid binding domain [Trinorchestia longiramus]